MRHAFPLGTLAAFLPPALAQSVAEPLPPGRAVVLPGPDAATSLQMLGLPARIAREVESRRVVLPNVGTTVTEIKAVDPLSGEVRSLAVDEAGRPVDFSAMRRAEVQARAANPAAKLHPDLAAACAQKPTARLEVVAWLHFDGTALDACAQQVFAAVDQTNTGADEVRRLEAVVQSVVEGHMRDVTGPFAEALAAAGIAATHVSRSAPTVSFAASRAQLLEIAARAEVDTIYAAPQGGVELNEDANAVHRTTRVHQMGVRGRGVRFCALGKMIDVGHPYLDVAAYFNPAETLVSSHSVQVAGCTASTHPDRLGSSPDVGLWCANFPTIAGFQPAADWIPAQNVDVTNLSYSTGDNTAIQYEDRYFEFQVRYYQDSYVTAAGNNGNGTGNVPSPSKGWNILTVGNHTDNGNGNWTGNAMNSSSSWVDPDTGCEKPNVAANGTGISTVDWASSGYLSGSVTGTSYASPHCAGNLCNAMVVNTAIMSRPEAAMALMMATAWHNIEGATRLSEYDGAGGIHGLAAYRAARENRVRFHSVLQSNFSNNGYFTDNIHLVGGDRARICIAWSASAAASYSTATLDADLDISIFQGSNQTSGTSYGSSASFNNNFEIVEFTPPVTGFYTIRINDYRYDGSLEHIGIAWSQQYRDTSSFKLRERSAQTTTLAGPTIGNPDYYLDFDAPDSPNAAYMCFPYFAAPYSGPGTAYSAQTWQPMTNDFLTALWVDDIGDPGFTIWTGAIGVLNSAGASTANRISLVNLPDLIGLPVWHIGVTQEAGYPDGIKQLGEVHSFTHWPIGSNQARADNGSLAQPLPAGFRFYGNSYTQCWINMNGSITFGGPDYDESETVAEFLVGRPRIAFLWDDLNMAANGSAGTPHFRTRRILTGPADRQRLVIEFVNVPQNGRTDVNTVRVTLHGYTGTIEIEYLNCDSADCIVGLSPGNGVSGVTTEVDFTKSGQLVSGVNNAIFEHFLGCSLNGGCDVMDLDSPNNSHWNVVRFTQEDLFAANSYRLHLDLQ